MRARRVELLVLEQLDEPAEREDRRAQLVRGVRDELAPRAVDALELSLHLVERARELPELVLGVHRERRDEPSAGHLLGGVLEALYAAREPAGDQVAADQREQQRAGAGHQDAPADQVDGLGDVLEAARVHRDPRPQARQRPRDLRGVDATEVGRPPDRLARVERFPRDLVGQLLEPLRLGVGDRVEEDVVALLHAEQGHLRAGGVRDRADELVELGGRDRPLLRALQLPAGRARGALEVVELLVLQARAKLRHDEEEDEAERERDDPEEQERQLVAERPKPRVPHSSRKW